MNDIQLHQLLDKKKWFHYIPVIGPMIYAIRFELKLVDLKKEKRTSIKFYRSIFNLVTLCIGITFLVLTLVLRDTHGFGHWPWIFWVGFGVGLAPNLSIHLPQYLYNKGFKRWDKKVSEANARLESSK